MANAGESRSSSLEASFSSDKENRSAPSRRVNGAGNVKRGMGNDVPVPSRSSSRVDDGAPGFNKRRKLGGRGGNAPTLEPSQVALNKTLGRVDDLRYYDPDQPIAERREVRKGIRDLSRNLAGTRAPGSESDIATGTDW